MLDVLHALFQQVRTPGATAVEESERVARLRIRAERDHAELRSRLAKPKRSLDALVDPIGRHADVGDDNIWPFDLDRFEQRVEVTAGGRDFEIRLGLEQAPYTLANEVVVLGEHEAYRHSDQHMTARPFRP